ncbi:MAG: HD domain-containing protein, partial [bacterium]
MTPDQPITPDGQPTADADRISVGDVCAPGLTDHIEKLGPVLINCLHSAVKTLQIYDINNRASQTVLSRLHQIINDLADIEERVTLAVSTELLLINEVRIIVDTQCTGPLLYLIEEMKKRSIEEIDFEPDVSTGELGSLVQLFGAEPDPDDPFGELSRKLTDAGVKRVRLTEAIERVKYLRDARVGRQEIREESNRAMSRAILFMGEVIRSVEHRRPIQMPKAHRLTQQISDIIRKDETVLLGLASIKDYDEYTFSHSVNVSVLSMLIAERMGLPKSDVSQIGVAALFHDIGKTHVPRNVLNKPGTLTADEWMLMQRHAMLGVIELSRVRSLRSIVDPIFVALQHHLLYNGTGYPKKPGGWALHPYIHIVTVADVFDAMTTPRVYRTESLTPDRALC